MPLWSHRKAVAFQLLGFFLLFISINLTVENVVANDIHYLPDQEFCDYGNWEPLTIDPSSFEPASDSLWANYKGCGVLGKTLPFMYRVAFVFTYGIDTYFFDPTDFLKRYSFEAADKEVAYYWFLRSRGRYRVVQSKAQHRSIRWDKSDFFSHEIYTIHSSHPFVDAMHLVRFNSGNLEIANPAEFDIVGSASRRYGITTSFKVIDLTSKTGLTTVVFNPEVQERVFTSAEITNKLREQKIESTKSIINILLERASLRLKVNPTIIDQLANGILSGTRKKQTCRDLTQEEKDTLFNEKKIEIHKDLYAELERSEVLSIWTLIPNQKCVESQENFTPEALLDILSIMNRDAVVNYAAKTDKLDFESCYHDGEGSILKSELPYWAMPSQPGIEVCDRFLLTGYDSTHLAHRILHQILRIFDPYADRALSELRTRAIFRLATGERYPEELTYPVPLSTIDILLER